MPLGTLVGFLDDDIRSISAVTFDAGQHDDVSFLGDLTKAALP